MVQQLGFRCDFGSIFLVYVLGFTCDFWLYLNISCCCDLWFAFKPHSCLELLYMTARDGKGRYISTAWPHVLFLDLCANPPFTSLARQRLKRQGVELSLEIFVDHLT